jgi:hypothetical protein
MNYQLRKPLTIPAGTIFTEAPSKTVYHSEHIQADVALGYDNTISVVVPVEDDAAFSRMFGEAMPIGPSVYLPPVRHLMQYFTYEHLPDHLQLISEPFCVLAKHIADYLPDNPEKTAALRKLLESKDCAVRAAL